MERNIDGVIKQVISYTYFKYLMSKLAKSEWFTLVKNWFAFEVL
jgi:hypothetical protein